MQRRLLPFFVALAMAAGTGCPPTPSTPSEDCANGADDDEDGDTDCADSDCAGADACRVEDCTNGEDDDGDNKIDCLDEDCASHASCQNAAPTAVDDALTTAKNTAVTVAASTLVANDTDPDGDLLSVTQVSGATHGTVALAGGQVTFTPENNFVGEAGFDYTVGDGHGHTDTGHVTVTVTGGNEPPVAVDDATTTAEDAPAVLAAAALLGNDTDPDGDTLTLTAVANATHGTVALSGTQVTFTPEANYHGTATFEYTVSDGTLTDTGLVTVTVTPVNDLPVAVDDTLVDTATEDGTLEIPAATLLANDTDADGDTLEIASVTAGTGGTVTYASGTVTFTGAQDFFGTATFTYVVGDGHGGESAAATVTLTVVAANDAPIATADAFTTSEDTTLVITVAELLANDVDIDLDTLTVTSVEGATNCTATLDTVAATVTLVPDPNFVGEAVFTYTVSDPSSATSTAMVRVNVTAVEDVPVATPDTATTAEDTPLAIAVADLLANDLDGDGDTLTVSAVAAGEHGTVVLEEGTITFTPEADFHGEATFTYTVNDGKDNTATGTVTVTVTPVQDTPVAVADALTTAEDTPLAIPVADLLANDTDADGDTLSLAGVTAGENGTVSLDEGTITFTPAANFHGEATFTYTVSDGNDNTATGTVTVTVSSVEDLPVALADAFTTAEDTPLAVPVADLLANDTDGDGDTLTLTTVAAGGHGTVTLEEGTVTFTPEADFNGEATFTYTVDDGKDNIATGTVTVVVTPVVDVPVAVADTATTAEDTPVTLAAADLVANDLNPDGATLTANAVTAGTGGTVALADGIVTFTPAEDFNGEATFTYSASDGRDNTYVGTVTVTVTPVNDAPVASANATANGTEDSTLDIPQATLLANVTDVDGDTLNVTAILSEAGGNAFLEADGSITFVPNANKNSDNTAEFQVTYLVSDTQGGTVTQRVDVMVSAVNDAPVANNDTVGTDEDVPVLITNAQMTLNDVDVDDNDVLRVTAVANVTNGTADLAANGDVTFTPAQDFVGTAGFDYTVSDLGGLTSTARVTINVGGINDAPVAHADAITTNEDQAAVLAASSLVANDTDADGDTLTVRDVGNAANGTVTLANGLVTFTPNPDFNGTASFTYTVWDGKGGTDTGTVTVTVNPVNDNPVANDDVATTAEDTQVLVPVADLLLNDTDVDNDSLFVSSVTSAEGGTAVLLGTQVRFTPNANFHGTARFHYAIGDGQTGTDSAVVTVTVTPVNDAPVATADSFTIAEDNTLNIGTSLLLANDSDVDGDSLTVESVQDATHGAVAKVGAAVTFTPNPNFHGTATFTYTISDGQGATATASVTVTVTPVNDPPVANDDSASTLEDTPVAIPVSYLMENDDDVDLRDVPSSETLTVVSVFGATNGTVSLAGDQVTFTPTENFQGTASFRYTIRDAAGATATAFVTVTVDDQNQPPVAVDDSGTTAEDTPFVVSSSVLVANDTDSDNDPLRLIAVSDPVNGTVALSNGVVTFTPAANFHGVATFNYTLSDGFATDVGTVTITVTPVNDAPVAVRDDFLDAVEDVPYVLDAADLAVNDLDVESDPLTVLSVQDPVNGTVVLADGVITFTPAQDFNGVARFDYQVTDSNGGNATGRVTLTFAPVNDAPVAVADTVNVAEEGTVTVNVLANDTDVDLLDQPSTEVLVVVSVGAPAPVGCGAAVVTGNAVRFTGGTDFTGACVFSYMMEDAAGEPSSANVTVNVSGANDPPVAVDDVATTAEDTVVVVSVLNNDTDPDLPADSLTVTGLSGVSNGTAQITGTGRTVTFTPAANFNGVVTFVYTVRDAAGASDTGQVTITVTPVNDPPVAVNDAATTAEDTPVAIAVLANDLDPDVNDTPPDVLSIQGTPTCSVGTGTVEGTSVRYTPPLNFNGTATCTYVVTDGDATSTGTITITVTPVNDPPVAHDDTATTAEDTPISVDVAADDTDPENSALTVLIGTVPPASVGTAAVVDNKILFTPAANYHGPASVTYRVRDTGNLESNSAVLSITVTPVNDAPVAADDVATTNEDTSVTIVVLANDTDVDMADSPPDVISVGGTVTCVNGTGARNPDNRRVDFMPAPNFFGTATCTYTVRDLLGASDTGEITITVNAVNDPPVVGADSGFSTPEDTPLFIEPGLLLANDTDVDGDTLYIHAVVSVSGGLASLEVDGRVKFSPTLNFSGQASFQYTVRDGNGGTGTGQVTVTVLPDADSPIANNDEFTTNEDTNLVVTDAQLLANDTDPDGDPITVVGVYSVVDGKGTVTRVGSTITFTPDLNYSGTQAYFIYDITDGTNIVGGTVQVNVVPVADQPNLVVTDASGNEDTAIALSIDSALTDTDGSETLAVVVAGVPAGASLSAGTDLGGGQWRLTKDQLAGLDLNPPAHSNVEFSLTVTARSTETANGVQATRQGTINVTLDGVADKPLLAVTDPAQGNEDTAIPLAITTSTPDTDGSETLTVYLSDVPAGVTLSAGVAEGTRWKLTPAQLVGLTATPPLHSYADFTIGVTAETVENDTGDTDSTSLPLTVDVVPVNDIPVASPQAVSVAEDNQVDVTLTGADVEDPVGVLVFAISTPPAHGAILGTPPNVTYKPGANYNGPDAFEFTITDTEGGVSPPAVITVTVTPVNDAPVATDDPTTTPEDVPLALTTAFLLGNDLTGPPNESAQVLQVVDVDLASVEGGTIAWVGNDITYTPKANFHGVDRFSYRILDNGRTAGVDDPLGDVGEVVVNVTEVNDAPVPVNDTRAVNEDTALVFAANTLWANDAAGPVDENWQTLTVVAVSSPSAKGATVTLVAGTITYTPPLDYNRADGLDTFTYTVRDNGKTNGADDFKEAQATVTVDVAPVNDTPVAVNDEVTTNEDTVILVDVVANDVNVDAKNGDVLTPFSIGTVQNGAALIVGNKVQFTPSANFFGVASFRYRCRDVPGATSEQATVTVNVLSVNDLPVAADDVVSMSEDAPVADLPVVVNDSDPVEGSAIAIVAVSAVNPPAAGTVTFDADSIQFTVSPNFNSVTGGNVTFIYTIQDVDGGQDTATVTITVTEVNDAPTANADTSSTDEDIELSIPLLALLANDVKGPANEGAQLLTVTTVTSPTLGGATVAIVGGNVVYTPAANFNGEDVFSYTITDDGTTNGVADPKTSTSTVTVTVNAVNDPPVAGDDVVNMTEDAPTADIPVLLNDSDPVEGSAITVVAVGAVAPVGAGTLGFDTDSVQFTPAANFNSPFSGDVTFTYTIRDAQGGEDTGTVTITVTEVNDAPVAVNDSNFTNEDTPLAFDAVDLLVNDTKGATNESAQTLSVTAVSAASAQGGTVTLVAGTVTYTPATDFNGTDTFTYTITDDGTTNGVLDAKTAVATVTVTVNSVNDLPVALDDAFVMDEDDVPTLLDVLANDTDPVENTSIFVVSLGPVFPVGAGVAAIEGAGTQVSFTPSADFNTPFSGDVTFTYTIQDADGGTDEATVTINVREENDAPTANNDTAVTDEDTQVAIPLLALLANDVKGPGNESAQTLTVTAVQGTTDQGGTAAIVAGNVVFTPALNFNGTDTFTYTITDNGTTAGLADPKTSVATVTVTVNSVNDLPVALDDVAAFSEDAATQDILVLANDSDPVEGSAITVVALGELGPAGAGTLTFDADSVQFTPAADFNSPSSGNVTFTYTIRDADGGEDMATVTIRVWEVNDAPTANADAKSTNEDDPLAFPASDLVANDVKGPTNEDGQSLTVTLVSAASSQGGTVALAGGTITYTPAANFFGTDTFTYTMTDNGTTDGAADPKTATATVTVTVASVNDLPVAVDDAVSVVEDTVSQAIAVMANDSDPVEGSALTLVSVTQPAEGGTTAVVGSNVVFYPVPNYNGTITFDYTIADADGGQDVGTVTVTVTGVPDSPVARADSFDTPVNTDIVIMFSSLLLNDTDADTPYGDSIFVAEIIPDSGVNCDLSVLGDRVVVTPDTDFVGYATFPYTVEDSTGRQHTAVVTVDVGDFCGDGQIQGTEECDDNNQADGDGCSATCTLEPENVMEQEPNDDIMTAQVTGGGTVTINAMNKLEPEFAVDWFSFVVTDVADVSVETFDNRLPAHTTCVDIDTVIELWGGTPAGLLLQDDASGVGLCSRVVLEDAAAGTYFVKAIERGPDVRYDVVITVDYCPEDPLKLEPGLCGCGTPEGCVPDGWTCADEKASDGVCDCGCGALDPQCADGMSSSCAVNNCEPPGLPHPAQNWLCVKPIPLGAGGGGGDGDWCKVRSGEPPQGLMVTGVETSQAALYAQIWIDEAMYRTGVTTGHDPYPLLVVQVGVGPDGVAPSQPSWTWSATGPNAGFYPHPSDDEYIGNITIPAAAGSPYDFAARMSGDGGQTWVYCDLYDDVYDEPGTVVPAPKPLVINEVDYDNVGTDNAEFVEIYNPSSMAASLDGLALVVINGSGNLEYGRVALSGTLPSNGYALICPRGPGGPGTCVASIPVPGGTLVFNWAVLQDAIQNGAPDAVGLFHIPTCRAVDVLSYEGSVTAGVVTGCGAFNFVEGTATPLADDGDFLSSLQRRPNGRDTNNAIDDWGRAAPTPGLPNN